MIRPELKYTSKELAKWYIPRHYQAEGIQIITQDKDIYYLHLKHIKQVYNIVITKKESKNYIIIGR